MESSFKDAFEQFRDVRQQLADIPVYSTGAETIIVRNVSQNWASLKNR